jgi:glyoxylase-like metal-dependent hydrolase (beta-lactamase superfamily II)/8-oxo-dGTP pyrophosphatase MutT (NUDIX family)
VTEPRSDLGPYGHVVPRSASTVVLLRPGSDGPEVLLTHRPASMAFAPDLHVFPGGAVDADDGDPRWLARSALDPAAAAGRLGWSVAPADALASHVAAVRELLEEAGVLLAEPAPASATLASARSSLLAGEIVFLDLCERLDVTLRTDVLVPLSRWVTPPVLPRRFDARFFAAWLPSGAVPTFEGDEVAAHRWAMPRAALAALASGEIRMWLPTSTSLQRLEHARDAAAVERLASGEGWPPEVEPVAPDIVRIAQSAGAGVDGLAVNSYLVGGRELVAVDPGDPSEEALLAIVEAAAGEGATIGAVALTSADPDHVGGAEHLLEGLGVPAHGGTGAGAPLPFETHELDDEARVPSGDVRLVALAAPGPRPDHVVYWVQASRSAIVGDLIGDGPARSVPAPPDVAAWRRSLARLAALEPQRVLPAHGEPIEGAGAVAEAIARAAAAIGLAGTS